MKKFLVILVAGFLSLGGLMSCADDSSAKFAHVKTGDKNVDTVVNILKDVAKESETSSCEGFLNYFSKAHETLGDELNNALEELEDMMDGLTEEEEERYQEKYGGYILDAIELLYNSLEGYVERCIDEDFLTALGEMTDDFLTEL